MNLKTINDAARMLGVGEQGLRARVRRGEIRGMTIGTRKVVDVDEVRAYYAQAVGSTVDEVAERTGMTPRQVYTGIAEGWLPAVKRCGMWRMDMDEVIEAIERRLRGEDQ